MLRKFGWQVLAPTSTQASFIDWWLTTKKRVRKARRKCFDSVVALVAWKVWLQCNTRVFGGHQVPPSMLAELVGQDCDLWCRARLIDMSHLIGS
jgi:hypothetical protein